MSGVPMANAKIRPATSERRAPKSSSAIAMTVTCVASTADRGDEMQREDAGAERGLDGGVGEEDQRRLVVPGVGVERLAVADVLRDGGEDALVAVPARLEERRVVEEEGDGERRGGERRVGGGDAGHAGRIALTGCVVRFGR